MHEQVSIDDAAARQVLRALESYSPRLARGIERSLDRPLRPYVAEIWKPEVRPRSAYAVAAARHLSAQLRSTLERTLPAAEVADACADWAAAPVMQTGPHSELLVDPISFYSMLLSALGARQAGRRWLFALTGAIVTLETRAGVGPGWLNVGGTRVNVFGLSARMLSKFSVCAVPGPVRFRFTSKECTQQALVERVPYFGALREVIHEGPYETASEAFERANHQLWESWGGNRYVRLAILNDDFYCHLMARHLEDDSSLHSKLLFDDRRRERLEVSMAAVADSRRGLFFSRATRFFWGIRGGRMRGLQLENGQLLEPGVEGGVCVPFERETLIRCLREGSLIPNLFLIYVALSILPRARGVGGLRLLGYYPLYQDAFVGALDATDAAERELLRELAERYELGWCMAMRIDPTHPLEWLGRAPGGSALEFLAERFGDETLRSTCGNLSAFRKHPEWGPLVTACEQEP